MDVDINGKKFQLKELLYLDVVELGEVKDKKANALKLLELSGVPKEVSEKLTITEGAKLMESINELNGFNTGFQKTSSVDKSS